MKERYYTIKDHKGDDRVTICLLDEDGSTARGLSICDWSDNFDSRYGKQLAYRNAIRAFKKRRCDKIVKKQAINMLIATRCPFHKKGELNPQLTWFEKRLLYGRHKMFNIPIQSKGTTLVPFGRVVVPMDEVMRSAKR